MTTPRGSTWVTDDISSVAAWVKPGRTPISDALRTRLDEEPAALFGDRLEAVDALDAETASLRPAGPHWYLATVGTRLDRRREGLASLVIRVGLAACDHAGLPAAVETSPCLRTPDEAAGVTVPGMGANPDRAECATITGWRSSDLHAAARPIVVGSQDERDEPIPWTPAGRDARPRRGLERGAPAAVCR